MGIRQPKSLATLVVLLLIGISAFCETASPAEPPKDDLSIMRAAVTAAHLTPYDVGSRYGQARGAAETCVGGKMTDKAIALSSLYTGANHEEFDAQQKKIYDAWMKVKRCTPDDSPNQCKVVIDESCAAALSEIGPTGTALPGLLDISRP